MKALGNIVEHCVGNPDVAAPLLTVATFLCLLDASLALVPVRANLSLDIIMALEFSYILNAFI